MKNFDFKKVKENEKIGSIEREFEFTLVDMLPSGFRSYKHLDMVYIRGLFYVETIALSKIGVDASLSQVISIYRDAIKFKDESFSIEDLEFSDFILLMTIVNINTVGPDYGWSTGVVCDNIIKNPKLQELEGNLEFFNELLKDLMDEDVSDYSADDKLITENKIKELNSKIEEAKNEISEIKSSNEFIKCNTKLSSNILLQDLEFDVSDDNIELPAEIEIGGKTLYIKPITVRDYINYKNNCDEKLENGTPKILFSKSLFIKNNIPDEEKIDTVKYMTPIESEKFNELIEKLDIKLNPVIKKCQRCGKEYKIKIGITNLKVYP